MYRRRGAGRGFTIVELLVVIAIIGVLVSLLLPAVQYARETARRITCVNRQKQIALALQAYSNLHKKYPPAAVYVGDPSDTNTFQYATFRAGRDTYLDFPPAAHVDFRDNGWGATWVTMLLPFIEQQGLADQYDYRLPAGDPINELVASQDISLMICPSFGKQMVAETPDGYNGKFAKGNYAVNVGGRFANRSTGPHGWENTEVRSPFAFYPIYGARSADLEDGLSNTVIVSEILSVGKDDDTRGCWARIGGAIFSMHVGNRTRCAADQFIATPNPPPSVDRCFRDCPTHCEGDTGLPCDDCPGAATPGRLNRGGIAARSDHTAGVNVALADGSVRFVSNGIDKDIWRALLTIMAGDVVRDF